jgi:NADPH-dependent stearoyl-CoA 9-desaturase
MSTTVPVRDLVTFGEALDALKARSMAEVGCEDLRRVRGLNRLSRGLEIAGRVLIHLSLDPVTWGAGVMSLFLHKQLQATEIGHPVLHGCYDRVEGGEKFRSESWNWVIPIDEEAWKKGHNIRHHGFTNVAGKDPDIMFGPVRLTDQTPHTWQHYIQLPYTLFVMWPGFATGMNSHFTGLLDITRKEPEVLPDRSWGSIRTAVKQAFRKYVPYFGMEYGFFPALAGPMFWKVLLGNWLSERMRDVYTAASIFCGHIGEDVATFDEGTRAGSRARWYVMQVQAAQNFRVPYVLSVLCGGLDYQIEHHLFPKLPPERLRQIAPEVQALCEQHGVAYNTGTWPQVLGRALSQVWRLSFPQPAAS